MALKKLPNNKNVKYINPETGKVDCTYNDCFTKFIESSRTEIWTPKVSDGYLIVKFRTHHHECTECKRTQSSSSDKRKSMESYKNQIKRPMEVASLYDDDYDPELILTSEEKQKYTNIIDGYKRKRHNA